MSATAMATACEIANCERAGKASGFMRAERVMFIPGCDSQELPLCPRPAVCLCVYMTDACGSSGAIEARMVFVDVASGRQM